MLRYRMHVYQGVLNHNIFNAIAEYLDNSSKIDPTFVSMLQHKGKYMEFETNHLGLADFIANYYNTEYSTITLQSDHGITEQ